MKIKEIEISKDKFEINLKFYYFLKLLVKAKLTEKQCILLFTAYNLANTGDKSIADKRNCINDVFEKSQKSSKYAYMLDILEQINNDIDLELFLFSIKLFLIKDLLLAESKSRRLLDITKLAEIHPLSLEYDKITLYSPYSQRVNGALLSLLFFDTILETNFITKCSDKLIKSIAKQGMKLLANGIEPNQIFMLLFNESINQSIISDSGSNYEDRILQVLKSIGIPENTITTGSHDKADSSTEFDFFFTVNNKNIGIGAKRTLRERYKQFIKTAHMSKLDIMIEITLGIDLTPEKVKSIIGHNVLLFVSPEIYSQYSYLKETKGVFSTSDLTVDLLISLTS